MTEKVLIYFDAHKAQDLQAAVELTAERCSELIDQFNNFQPWKRIATIEDFIELVSDPRQMFDNTLLANVDIKATGGRKGDPEIIARLFDISREDFLALTAGLSVREDCRPCGITKIRPGTSAISLNQYKAYEKYLNFTEGAFSVNQEAVEAQKATFSTYAETPAQMAVLRHWEALVDILNEHDSMYHINNTDKQAIKKAFGLLLSNGIDGSVCLNNESLKNLILKAN